MNDRRKRGGFPSSSSNARTPPGSMRRSCIGVLADSSKRRQAGAPPVCVGMPFRERDDGSWDEEDAEEEDDRERRSMSSSSAAMRERGRQDGWKFACVGYGSAAMRDGGGRNTTAGGEEEDDAKLPRCRGLEILVSEHVLDDDNDDGNFDRMRDERRAQVSREERRKRGMDTKEEEDFIVALREKPEENAAADVERRRRQQQQQQHRKRNVTNVDAEHKLPNELKNFDQRFYAQSKLILRRMEKHAKYIYSGAFMKDL
jgi:hypothetical protein